MNPIAKINRFGSYIAESLPKHGVAVTGFTPASEGQDANIDLGLTKVDPEIQVNYGYGVTLTPSGWVILYKYQPSSGRHYLEPVEIWHAGASNTLPDLIGGLAKEFGSSSVHVLRKTEFNIEDTHDYPGYTREEYWNGWAVPYFERDVAERVARDLSDDPAAETRAHFDEARNAFVFEMEGMDEPYVFEGELIDGKMLYSIGGYSWTWQEPVKKAEAVS